MPARLELMPASLPVSFFQSTAAVIRPTSSNNCSVPGREANMGSIVASVDIQEDTVSTNSRPSQDVFTRRLP